MDTLLQTPEYKQMLGLFQKDSRISQLPYFAIILHNKRNNYLYLPNMNTIEPILGKWSSQWYSTPRYIVGCLEQDNVQNVYFDIYSYYETERFVGYNESQFEAIWKKLYEPDVFLSPILFKIHEEYGIPNYMAREISTIRKSQLDNSSSSESQHRDTPRVHPYERKKEPRSYETRYGYKARTDTRTEKAVQYVDNKRNEGTSTYHAATPKVGGILMSHSPTEPQTPIVEKPMESLTTTMTSMKITATPSASTVRSEYFIKKTDTVDVYEVYDSKQVYITNASIPSLKLSRSMSEAFERRTNKEYVPMEVDVKIAPNGTKKYIPKL